VIKFLFVVDNLIG